MRRLSAKRAIYRGARDNLHRIVDETDFAFVVLDHLPESDIFDMMEVDGVYSLHRR